LRVREAFSRGEKLLQEHPAAARGGDALISVEPALQRAPRFADLLESTVEEQTALKDFEIRSANGRPLGTRAFLASVGQELGRSVTPRKRRPKPKAPAEDAIG
jgi:hypothetical protein